MNKIDVLCIIIILLPFRYYYMLHYFHTDNTTPSNCILVYSDALNVRLFGLEKLHPFDSTKYYNIMHILTNQLPLLDEAQLVAPQSDNLPELIASVHSNDYLKECLATSVTCIAHVAEMYAFSYLPLFVLQRYLLAPMQMHVAATVTATQMVLQPNSSKNVAIVLGGGMHHAYQSAGGGWCFYDDVIIAARHAKCQQKLVQRIMIIDTDAHQGNGYQRDVLLGMLRCNNESRANETYILDMYNPHLYPHDQFAKHAINKTVHVYSQTTTNDYLAKLQQALDSVTFEPQVIFFVSGTKLKILSSHLFHRYRYSTW